MSEHFDVRKDSAAIRAATQAFVECLLKKVMPDLRLAARGCGYALAVHGSKSRDIDLLAVPWVSNAQSKEFLADRLLGVLAGKVGRAVQRSEWVEKPHGRMAVLLLVNGMDPEIDLSVMPLVGKDGK